MDILVELIFRGLIVNYFGLYSRFYFFKIFGVKKSIPYLSGEEINKDKTEMITQHVFNVLVGFIVFGIFSFTIVFLIWG